MRNKQSFSAIKPDVPTHPGEILKELFMDEYDLTAYGLAKSIGVNRDRIEQIVRGARGISGDTDLRLSKFFGVSKGYWLNLQNAYDLRKAEIQQGDAIEKIIPITVQQST